MAAEDRRYPGCPLDWDVYGSLEFVEQFVQMVAYGDDGRWQSSQFGKDISSGFVRAAEKWGRREQDLNSGILFPYWGFPCTRSHAPRSTGAMAPLGDRDINEHDFDWIKADGRPARDRRRRSPCRRPMCGEIITDKMVPLSRGPAHARLQRMPTSTPSTWPSWSPGTATTRASGSSPCCSAMSRWPDFVNVHAPGQGRVHRGLPSRDT